MGEVCQAISTMTTDSGPSGPSSPSIGRALSNWIEPHLLRGIALHHCIYGWRRNLARQGESNSSDYVRDFHRSRPVTRLHNFLSHDWQTQGWLKVVALVILFNSKAAALCTLCMSIIVGLLRGFDILPDEFWTNFIGHATFIFVLCFWQKILMLWSPRMVFLDRLCIAQNDAALKEKGILGLAAFLDRSDELTILWSPRYFRRLWCTYEIATYFRHRKMDRPVQMMPVTLSLLILVHSISWFIMIIAYHIIVDLKSDADESWRRNVAITSLCVLVASILKPWTFYLDMQMISELQEMPAQLKNFRVQDAESSCCSKEHVNTETSEEIPCDRQIVFSTLCSWYAHDDEQNQEAHLDEFNRLVQKRLAPLVLKSAGGDALPLRYTWYMVGCCEIPFVATVVSKIVHGRPEETQGFLVIIWILRLMMQSFFLSLLAVYATRISMTLSKFGSRMKRCTGMKARICLALVLSQLAIACVAVHWSSFAMVNNLTENDTLWPVVPFSILVAFLTIQFCLQAKQTKLVIGPEGDHQPTSNRQLSPSPMESGMREERQASKESCQSTFEI